MNRRLFYVLGVVCTLLILGACASNSQVIFDENLPLEKSSRMVIYSGLNIKAYNGISVPQKKVMGSTISTWYDVYLPPGDVEFLCDLSHSNGNYHYIAKDIFFRYKFEPGMVYSIVFFPAGGPDKNKWGVNIFGNTGPQLGRLQKDNLLAFVPFYKVE
jgi:hypothetical protein